MRPFFFYIAFCVLAPAAFAQAADPNAIDLSGKMDTIATGSQDLLNGLNGFLNVGLQNSDKWEDFEINHSGVNQEGRMRFGGPFIFDTVNNPSFGKLNGDLPNLFGDFDGDGIGDIISYNLNSFYKGKKTFPYFDAIYTSQFKTVDKFASFYFFSAIDFDEDGVADLLAGNDDNRIRFFKGGPTFGKNQLMFATDSIQFQTTISAVTAGKINPKQKPLIICYGNRNFYLIKQTGNSFAQDSVILIGDSATGGIVATNLYATDITGDGITDLIVSDGLHIYIFKGGDDFGTYPLTPKNAFYTITSPRITDVGNWFSLQPNFGNYMHACGDLTGFGIPFLAVNATYGDFITVTFFYAGGKALDTLYDAIIRYENSGQTLDTLHSIDSTGRTVCLINDFQDYKDGNIDLDLLMSRSCDMIPHRTNPTMINVVSRIQEGFEASCYPSFANKFEKIRIISDQVMDGKITIYNLLGNPIAIRKVYFDQGENIEFFNTVDWNSGTYIIKIESGNTIQTTKFFIRH